MDTKDKILCNLFIIAVGLLGFAFILNIDYSIGTSYLVSEKNFEAILNLVCMMAFIFGIVTFLLKLSETRKIKEEKKRNE